MGQKELALKKTNNDSGAILLGTGLAFASLILFPAIATRIGLGPSLTGAMRIALMKASSRAIGGKDGGSDSSGFSCH